MEKPTHRDSYKLLSMLVGFSVISQQVIIMIIYSMDSMLVYGFILLDRYLFAVDNFQNFKKNRPPSCNIMNNVKGQHV